MEYDTVQILVGTLLGRITPAQTLRRLLVPPARALVPPRHRTVMAEMLAAGQHRSQLEAWVERCGSGQAPGSRSSRRGWSDYHDGIAAVVGRGHGTGSGGNNHAFVQRVAGFVRVWLDEMDEWVELVGRVGVNECMDVVDVNIIGDLVDLDGERDGGGDTSWRNHENSGDGDINYNHDHDDDADRHALRPRAPLSLLAFYQRTVVVRSRLALLWRLVGPTTGTTTTTTTTTNNNNSNINNNNNAAAAAAGPPPTGWPDAASLLSRLNQHAAHPDPTAPRLARSLLDAGLAPALEAAGWWIYGADPLPSSLPFWSLSESKSVSAYEYEHGYDDQGNSLDSTTKLRVQMCTAAAAPLPSLATTTTTATTTGTGYGTTPFSISAGMSLSGTSGIRLPWTPPSSLLPPDAARATLVAGWQLRLLAALPPTDYPHASALVRLLTMFGRQACEKCHELIRVLQASDHATVTSANISGSRYDGDRSHLSECSLPVGVSSHVGLNVVRHELYTAARDAASASDQVLDEITAVRTTQEEAEYTQRIAKRHARVAALVAAEASREKAHEDKRAEQAEARRVARAEIAHEADRRAEARRVEEETERKAALWRARKERDEMLARTAAMLVTSSRAMGATGVYSSEEALEKVRRYAEVRSAEKERVQEKNKEERGPETGTDGVVRDLVGELEGRVPVQARVHVEMGIEIRPASEEEVGLVVMKMRVEEGVKVEKEAMEERAAEDVYIEMDSAVIVEETKMEVDVRHPERQEAGEDAGTVTVTMKVPSGASTPVEVELEMRWRGSEGGPASGSRSAALLHPEADTDARHASFPLSHATSMTTSTPTVPQVLSVCWALPARLQYQLTSAVCLAVLHDWLRYDSYLNAIQAFALHQRGDIADAICRHVRGSVLPDFPFLLVP